MQHDDLAGIAAIALAALAALGLGSLLEGAGLDAFAAGVISGVFGMVLLVALLVYATLREAR